MDESERDEYRFFVDATGRGTRLDLFLTQKLPEVSRAQIQRFIATHAARVNDKPARASQKVETSDIVTVAVPPPRPTHIEAQSIPLDIVFEDSDLLVIDKPKGLVVHPAPGAEDGTLVNALLAHCTDLSGVGGVERPGIVHRLDRDTTGLLMVAKNDLAHHSLQAQIQARTAKRRYLALIWGRPPFVDAQIDAAIARHPTDRKRMTVVADNSALTHRPALTHATVREQLGPIAVLECALQTGRTHQIRVHCQFAGHPVVGDPVYGGLRKVGAEWARGEALLRLNDTISHLTGQCLHAFSLAFEHPRTGEALAFESPIPPEMRKLTDLLKALPG